MDLLSEVFLVALKEAKFPYPKQENGQIWFDTISKRHGVIMGNIFHCLGGSFIKQIIDINQYLYQPTIQDFILLTPQLKVQLWGGQFSAKIDDVKNPKTFIEENPLEACVYCYLYCRKNII
jgi:hypothetical protein